MKNIYAKTILTYLFLVIVNLTCTTSFAADSLLGGRPQEQHIIVNNRILTKVNGKAISVIDVMKKMDLLFFRQFPQYSSSAAARYQFYQMHWKKTLNEIIDKELILVDAEEMKLNVNPGDVRQEMETLFGPNIIVNLDKAGLTFNEAYQMVLDDIIIRRMLYFRVQLKILAQVTPQEVRTYYDEFAKDNIRDHEWIFNLVTIRQRDSAKAAETANLVYRLLNEDKVPLDKLVAKLNEMKLPEATKKTVTVSEQFITKEKELSDVFRQNLTKLTPDSYSIPVVQKSRADNSSVFRIFYLKSMNPGGVIPFNEIETKIKAKLIDDGINTETEKYFKNQRQHFDVQDSQLEKLFSSDFEPFTLN